jgi:hypothetical protein
VLNTYPLFGAEADELHGGLGLVRRFHLPGAVEQVHEGGLVNLELVLAVLFHGFLFGEANRANGRVGKHHLKGGAKV